MNDFILDAANEAAQFLREFPSEIRQRGEQYFRAGAVSHLRCVEPGSSFEATVEGSESYETSLSFVDGEGWVDDCSCPYGSGCKHAYAMMKTLLAAHTEAMRGAPAGRPAVQSQTKAPKFVELVNLARVPTPEPPPPASSLHAMALKALGRPLKLDERRFVQQINALWRRIQVTQGVYPNDLKVLGFPDSTDIWNRIELWPSPPVDEHELWLYLAMYLEEHGRAVPEFLRPVSDLTRIRDRIQRWRRGREVERWRKMLEHAQPGDLFDEARADVDLRLRFAAKEITLEWRAGAEMEFAPFKSVGAFRSFDQCYAARLLPEAMLIWNGFRQRAEHGHHGKLTYNETDCVRILLPLLRQSLLESRLVGETGLPLLRPAEPLRWSLDAGTDDQSDYGLRLVQADGSSAPPLILVVGKFFLSADTLFLGPPLDGRVLNPSAENRIPAAALETRSGLRFLNALKVPLPARLESRIQRVNITARVRCELQPNYPGSDNEVCVVQFLADATDGSRNEHWAYNGWELMNARPEWAPASTKPKKEPEHLVVYERAGLPDCAALLAPLGAKWDFQRSGWQLRVTKKFPEVFVPWLKGLPPTLAVELRGELATFLNATVSGEVKLEVSEAGMDWFDLQVVVNVSDTELTPEEIKLLLNAKGKWVRLGPKGWRKLDFNLTEDDDAKLAKLGLTPRELSAEPQRLHALQLADDAAKRFLPEEQFERVQRRARELQARVTPDVPAEIKAELRPYQRDGFHFLAYLSANHFGGILADDMGLGKTLQALCWLAWLRGMRKAEGGVRNGEAGRGKANNSKPQTPNPKPCLVVCPKSVTDNWRAESERFLPGLHVKVWRGNEVGTLPEHTGDADLHVLNYSQLRIVGEALSQVDFLAVILDEGQYIKNPSSITAQIARTLRGEHRLVLSGTPIENRLMDLWSLMSFAMPGALGSRTEFGRLFDGRDDPFARPRLAARVRPFLLRRTKTQVAKDLPDRVEEDLFCELEGEQKTLYRAELKRAQQMLLKVTTQKQLNKDRFHLLTSLLRLRQICCHPKLVKADSKAASAKVEALLEQLEPLMDEGQKVLVFSQFVELLGLLSAELKAREWREFYLAGETENRGELVREFQSAEGAGVFLISLKAGGFGLNLTAASYVVLFDPWWNPAVENQAIDRTHRIGQMNKVIAYRLLIKDSIEEKIRALQTKKKALAADVLGEEKFSQSLTLDDLRFLFAD